MFDVGFWELTLIMLVVLVVVGPERLPKLARTVGVWTNRARRMVSDVKAEVEREVRAQELKESMGGDALKEVRSVTEEMQAIGRDLNADLANTGTDPAVVPDKPQTPVLSEDDAGPTSTRDKSEG